MKLLLDTCVWGGSQDALHRLDTRSCGRMWTPVMMRSYHVLREGRILITLDKDFGELVIVRGQSHAGIIRLVGWSAQQQVFHMYSSPQSLRR